MLLQVLKILIRKAAGRTYEDLLAAAGRGYDADWFREALKNDGIRLCIPGRTSRSRTLRNDTRRCKRRNRIGRMF